MDYLLFSAFDVLLTVTGKLLVSVLSLGRWRADPLMKEEGRIYGAAGSFSFVREGRRVITHTGQLFIGLAFYVVLAVALVVFWTR
jgi:hypothetical protein